MVAKVFRMPAEARGAGCRLGGRLAGKPARIPP